MFNWLKNTLPSSTRAPQTAVGEATEKESIIPVNLTDGSTTHKTLGDKYFAEGKLEEAVACYQRALAINPDYAEVYNNLGNVFREQGLPDEAERCLKQAILIKPALVNAYCNLGSLLLKRGRPQDAIAHFSMALELKPDVEFIYRDLALALVQLEKFQSAKQVIEKGISLNPNFADFHYFMGNIYLHEQAHGKAIECYQRTLSIQPDFVEALANMAKVLLAQGKLDEAADYYRQILTIKPKLAEAHFNFGNTLNAQGNLNEAIICYQRALTFKPDFTYCLLHMGNIYKVQDRLDEALVCYKQAAAIQPDFADAYYSQGVIYLMQRNIIDALRYLQKTLSIQPEHNTARAVLIHQLQHRCEWGNLESNIDSLRAAITKKQATEQNKIDPLVFLALPMTTAVEQKKCAERFVHNEFKFRALLHSKLAFSHNRAHNQKIHIGYLSADFWQHPVAYLIAEIIELHDRNHFNITAYSFGYDDHSATRKRLEKGFDKFVDIQNDSYEDAAKKIYADHIDILIDLTGYTRNSRSAILAYRPAPIQINYLGYPGTMGADFIDYIVADKFIIPPEHQQHFTETVILMPDCFMPNDRTRIRLEPPSRREFGLPSDGFVFCCFNQPYKITPEIFNIWCRLLKAVPDSILWLPISNPQAEGNLKQEAENRGVAAGRIIMASKLPQIDAHLARLQCADLFLDTLPYNAHATCSDALWMGLPIITCVGETFPSRVAGSLLTAIGAPELITYNLEDYYHLALDLATDREKLATIRNKIIANRDTAPLFDSTRFTRNLEKLYIQMMDEHSKKSISSGQPLH